ncbi:MEKHLA domain-containing protein [Sphingomonas soli]|uniref:MEKHLA domain-containing protein n=1 Tax=Sphingomonas soli TaxID=266127 RepID=UPI0008362943|nr:MEKHLA domain-containing protein [Sphingomonas soli]
MTTPLPPRFATPAMRASLALIAESHLRLTGRALVTGAGDPQALWHAPFAIVAHGTQADPLFFFGNRVALDRFELSADAFSGMPSRLSAEPLLREERRKLLARVTSHGFIDDYAGVRISASGRRFRIREATVWNLVDSGGVVHGQAAAFARWDELD